MKLVIHPLTWYLKPEVHKGLSELKPQVPYLIVKFLCVSFYKYK